MTDLLPVEPSLCALKLRAEDYETLARTGPFDPYPRTELIDGSIYYINAQHRPHGIVKMELNDQLRAALAALGSKHRPVVEFSLALPPHDMPDPDLMLTK